MCRDEPRRSPQRRKRAGNSKTPPGPEYFQRFQRWGLEDRYPTLTWGRRKHAEARGRSKLHIAPESANYMGIQRRNCGFPRPNPPTWADRKQSSKIAQSFRIFPEVPTSAPWVFAPDPITWARRNSAEARGRGNRICPVNLDISRRISARASECRARRLLRGRDGIARELTDSHGI